MRDRSVSDARDRFPVGVAGPLSWLLMASAISSGCYLVHERPELASDAGRDPLVPAIDTGHDVACPVSGCR